MTHNPFRLKLPATMTKKYSRALQRSPIEAAIAWIPRYLFQLRTDILHITHPERSESQNGEIWSKRILPPTPTTATIARNCDRDVVEMDDWLIQRYLNGVLMMPSCVGEGGVLAMACWLPQKDEILSKFHVLVILHECMNASRRLCVGRWRPSRCDNPHNFLYIRFEIVPKQFLHTFGGLIAQKLVVRWYVDTNSSIFNDSTWVLILGEVHLLYWNEPRPLIPIRSCRHVYWRVDLAGL